MIFYLLSCKSEKPFDLIHFDAWGRPQLNHLMDINISLIYRYFLKIIWLYLIKNKGEVFSHFQDIYYFVEYQYNVKIIFLDLIMKHNL
jgi:hypothetical protein